MKHSLQLKLSQHLTLTPQLQQSIRLLQLSTLELNQEIEQFLQENPLLEREEEEESPQPASSTPGQETPEATAPSTAGESATPISSCVVRRASLVGQRSTFEI